MANTYLQRTFSTPTSSKIMTFSAWVKRGKIGATGFGGYGLLNTSANASGNGTYMQIGGDGNDRLQFSEYTPGQTFDFKTNTAFRDTSGWYHIVIAYDSTQATASDRVKFYINGVQETSFNTATYPSLNLDTELNSAKLHYIGNDANAGGAYAAYYDGSMSHIHFIDGTAYDATAFGEYDANGVWKIKTDVSVTYGNNGFFILKDGNSVTDQSGNGNNWTVGGGTLTNTEDNPSNVFATLNPLIPTTDFTFSQGNLKLNTGGSSQTGGGIGTIGVTKGKWYWELKLLSSNMGNHTHGIISELTNPYQTALQNKVGVTQFRNDDGGEMVKDGTQTSADYGTFSTGDIMGVALNADDNQISIYKNGSVIVSNFTISTTRGVLFPLVTMGVNCETQCNFGNGYFGTTAVSSAGTNASGNGIFEYDVPTGFTALSTKGLNL